MNVVSIGMPDHQGAGLTAGFFQEKIEPHPASFDFTSEIDQVLDGFNLLFSGCFWLGDFPLPQSTKPEILHRPPGFSLLWQFVSGSQLYENMIRIDKYAHFT
jgi:hypothetical protein